MGENGCAFALACEGDEAFDVVIFMQRRIMVDGVNNRSAAHRPAYYDDRFGWKLGMCPANTPICVKDGVR